MNVNVPDGAFLVFSETNKNTLAGLGLNGVCTDASGAADETKIRAGDCGTRAAWASGELTIGDLSPLLGAFSGGTDNINIGSILGQVQPLIRKLNSSIVRDVQFNMANAACAQGRDVPQLQAGLGLLEHRSLHGQEPEVGEHSARLRLRAQGAEDALRTAASSPTARWPSPASTFPAAA